MPRLNEGDLLIEAIGCPARAGRCAADVDADRKILLRQFPEVRTVYCKTGRPEIANDVMGVHQTDVWTMLKPQDEWPPGMSRDELIEEMERCSNGTSRASSSASASRSRCGSTSWSPASRATWPS